MAKKSSRSRVASAMHKKRRAARSRRFNLKRKSNRIRGKASIGKGFPQMLKTNLHYDDTFIQTSVAAGTVAFYNYRINSIYDFDYTGGGHKPFYTNQFFAVYDHYCVTGAKVTLAIINPSNVSIIAGAYINDDAAIGAPDLKTYMEEPYSQWRMIPPNQEKPVYLTFKWSAKKFFTGRTSSVLADTELQGTTATNPVELSFLTFFARAVDVTAATNVQYTVHADFAVTFKELTDITGS